MPTKPRGGMRGEKGVGGGGGGVALRWCAVGVRLIQIVRLGCMLL